MAFLFQGLKSSGLEAKVKVILVSDHSSADDVEVSLESGSYIMMYLKKNVSLDGVVDKIRKTLPPGVRVCKKFDIPEAYHYKNHETRIGDILLLVSRGYSLILVNPLRMSPVSIKVYEVSEYPDSGFQR